MLISDFIKQLNKFDGNKSIAVQISYPNGVAYPPNSPVIGLYQGIDWDSNIVFITTEHSLEKDFIIQRLKGILKILKQIKKILEYVN